ncbi:MAG: hypothetical protein A2745_03085 [Candidatus Harrisonbacteria bacterium RIFCSPHIGHO2_01_FULL_44_13]|uniref:YprB ribonuclease H-like domain-containing protein n=1 Tax=Candidatus Harrisonbacteria bacterium RIFCSPLOWO2_01_FULL_44_18 TaxID=1798407 RepID=A0A1G1ZL60_9BACT|nr:MAG: hypothetical protein A2745_03085 [Candidatus Harrisonbacteria bacterium RIFCSPHIGHO2_01_FULL_44_13]OGY65378.1 MAG: hypothetical protein A3A16_02935 [Candidatus Harrisonbacteria bacterium RIFCSPLOWO2_01_FULL_44_18]
MDKLVIDIETKNSFADVGGQDHLNDLLISGVGVYSYNRNTFLYFDENQLNDLAPVLQKAGLIIGFSINRFDIPVLANYFNFNLFAVPRLDLLDEIELLLGQRVGLDLLAKTNLGIGKTHYSLEAIKLYRDGNFEELKNYCLNDVKITKELYELAQKQGHLLVPKKITGELIKVNFGWQEYHLPATLL